MKRTLLTVLLACSGFALFAQNLDKAKDLLKSKKLADAKTEIDKVLASEKGAKNGEAWYVKAKIYNEIASDEALKATVPNARWEGFEALKKYVDLDDKKVYLSLQLEQYKPVIDMYQAYFKTGANDYNASSFAAALDNFKKCLTVSSYMNEKGWTNVKLDTSVILYTGISAEKVGNKDEAATYYGKLAEAKVTGEGMVEIYKWLADYYSQKKDEASTAKFLTLGKELYPKDAFWTSMEIDMARDKGDKNLLFTKYEEAIASDPQNLGYIYNYAIELYQDGYKQEVAQRPANSEALIAKAETNIKKVLAIKPDHAAANLVLGQIYYNQGVDLNAQAKAIKAPAGGKLKPEDQKKKDDLRAGMNKKFDEALPYFEKVDQVLGSQGKLKMEEKGYLKDAYDLLITIYDTKGNKDKLKVYEEKFNNVDKVH